MAATADSLCADCTCIDFAKLFAPTGNPDAQDSEDLFSRSLGELRDQTHCPFCRLIVESVSSRFPSLPGHTVCHARREQAGTVFDPTPGTANYYIGGGTYYNQICVSIHPDGFFRIPRLDGGARFCDFPSEEEKRQRRGFEFVIRQAAPESPPPPQPVELHDLASTPPPTPATTDMMRVRRVPPDGRVDLDLLRTWLRLCKERHANIGPTPGGSAAVEAAAAPPLPPTLPPDHLYVIDVAEDRLVSHDQAPAPRRYAALSYVWGPPAGRPQLRWTRDTTDRLFAAGGLRRRLCDDIPTTIADATDLCRDLGVGYLWVDALCIQQDNPVAMAHAIAAMDAVYQGAYLSIVAAAGVDSWAGLPGVGKGDGGKRRSVQCYEKVGNLTLANAAKGFEHVMLDSVWYTRAWTLQEYLLSNRLLVFAEEQVFFVCDHATWFETLVLEDVPHAPTMLRNELRDWRHEFKERSRGVDDILLYAANSIISRKLTYQSDRLNAFDGITKWISKTRRISFFQGLPVETFDGALLFQGTAEHRRNALFPSWSWAGWDNPDAKYNGRRLIYFVSLENTIVEIDWLRCATDKDGAITYQKLNNEKSWHFSTEHLEEALPGRPAAWVSNRGELQFRNYRSAADDYHNLTTSYGSTRTWMKNDESLFRKLAQTRGFWKMPPSRRPPIPLPPPCLTTGEIDQLLVFQTSCVLLEVEFESESKYGSSTEYIHRCRLPPGKANGLHGTRPWDFAVRLLWRVPVVSALELAVIARRAAVKNPSHSALETMAITTDERGISYRVDKGPYVPDQIWGAMEPQWRTVYML